MKKTFRKISAVILIALAFFLIISFPATASDPSAGGLVPCGLSGGTPCTLCHFIIGFQKLVLYGLYVVVGLALLMLVLTGITYTISTGSESLMNQAKGFLKSVLIGFTVVLVAYLIITGALWLLSTRGDLGVGQTSWTTFTCNVTSSALRLRQATATNNLNSNLNATNATPPAPGTVGTPCGNNNIGRCVAATGASTSAFTVCSGLGMQWIGGGTNCNSGLYCCANLLGEGDTCRADLGQIGTCERLYGTGTSTDSRVCPNWSWRLEQPTSYEVNCAPTTASGQPMGCCNMDPSNANTIPGNPTTPCGNNNLGTCSPKPSALSGPVDTCASVGKNHLSGGTDCPGGHWCCSGFITTGNACTSTNGQGTCQQLSGSRCPSGNLFQGQSNDVLQCGLKYSWDPATKTASPANPAFGCCQ